MKFAPYSRDDADESSGYFCVPFFEAVGQKRDADGNLRDLALFSTAIDTMLRSNDLLRLTVEDVTDDAGHVVDEITIRQQKTGEANVVGVSDYTRKVLSRWIIRAKSCPRTISSPG
jgi:integrase